MLNYTRDIIFCLLPLCEKHDIQAIHFNEPLKSKSNLADVVFKHWGHSSVYPLNRPVLNHIGDTAMLFDDDWYDL